MDSLGKMLGYSESDVNEYSYSVLDNGKRVRLLPKVIRKRGVEFYFLCGMTSVANDDSCKLGVRGEGFMVYAYRCGSEYYFEVFDYRIGLPNHFANDVDYDYTEVYPSDEAFGVWAWSIRGVDRMLAFLKDRYGFEEPMQDTLYEFLHNSK